MSNLYEDFEQDNMENEDDMAALGSILSWDEDEERSRNELTGQQTSSKASGLPQFSSITNNSENMKDDMGDLSFLQYIGGMEGSNNVPVSTSNSASAPLQQAQIPDQKQNFTQSATDSQQNVQQTQNFSQQLATLQQFLQQQQQQQPQQHDFNIVQLQQQQSASQQQDSQQQGQAQQQNAMSNQIAQFVAQQALSMLQQNQQAETQRKEQEKVQQEQARQQQQAQALNTVALLQQNLQLAMQQQQTPYSEQAKLVGQLEAQQAAAQAVAQQIQQAQQNSQQQYNVNDSSNFLQQLQIAQLQQQFQAAQQQSGQAGSAMQHQQQPLPMAVPNNQATTLQQQQLHALASAMRSQQQFQQQLPRNVQDQLKQQYAQVAGNVQIQAQGQQGGVPRNESKPSVAKKSKATIKKLPENVSEPDQQTSSGIKSDSRGLAGLVSASDTDNDLQKRHGSFKLGDDDDEEETDLSALTSEERAVMNRERNKEHARNTRLRKKAYLEKLKATVDDLCKERNTLVSERASAANLLVEMHNTRTEVLMSFFALRSTNEKRRHLWASILDESCFACIMPITPYRSFPASEMQVSKCQRTILGIDGIMSDTASLHVLFASLVDRIRAPLGKIEFRYTLVAEEAVVAGNQMMARWVMSTTNAMLCGAKMEVYKQGMLCSRFNSSHKIVGLELMFDVMAFMLQLKQAAGVESFTVVPNTVQTCQRNFEKPVIMTTAEPPYTIVQVNKLWEDMTGYSADEVVGKASCTILQGAQTDRKAVEDMMTEVRFRRATFASLINYRKTGESFRSFMCLYPLSTDSRIAHYLAIIEHTDDGLSTQSSSEQLQSMTQLPNSTLPLFSMFHQQGNLQSQQNMLQLTRNVNNVGSDGGAGSIVAQQPLGTNNLSITDDMVMDSSDSYNKRTHTSNQ